MSIDLKELLSISQDLKLLYVEDDNLTRDATLIILDIF